MSIHEQQAIYLFNKRASVTPAVATVKPYGSLQASIQAPYAPTGLDPSLTRVVQGDTGIGRYSALYSVGYTGVVELGVSGNQINVDVDLSGITGIDQSQYYGLSVKYQDFDSQRSRADIIIYCYGEVGDYV